jgi:uncharacterized glyoxalase superfamily protein PhnB
MTEQTTTTQTVFPILCYRDARAAIEWLERALGFEAREVHEDDQGGIVHAEVIRDGALVMLGSEGAGRLQWPPGAACVYLAIEDVDAHHDRAKAAGAEIVMEPTDQDYGSRDYVCRDPEGHLWCFGTYRPPTG